MEVKKSPKANLENKKMFYRELGLIIALGVILCAFEWSTSEKTESVIQQEEAAPLQRPLPRPPRLPRFPYCLI